MNNPEDIDALPSLQQQNADKRWAVRLRVYDISRGMAKTMSPMFLGRQINGVWHTGVEVYGTEYFYGGGISSLTPAQMERVFQLTPSRVVFMGYTSIEKSVCDEFLKGISPRFTEATYSLLEWNCNHFTNELTQFLVNKSIPDDILNQVQQVAETPMGRLLLPILQQQQRAAQQAASAAGQRTLWTRGEADSSTSSAFLSSSSSVPSSAVSAAGPSIATADDQWPSRTSTGVAATRQSRLGEALRRVYANDELAYNTKRIFLMALLTLVNNLLLSHRDNKYMRVKYGNPVIQSRILRIPGGEEALNLLGFERVASFSHGEVCTDAKGTASDNTNTTLVAHEYQCEQKDGTLPSTQDAGNIGQSDGGFAFKQFEQGKSEEEVISQLQAHKADIQAFLAALDRNKQETAAATSQTT